MLQCVAVDNARKEQQQNNEVQRKPEDIFTALTKYHYPLIQDSLCHNKSKRRGEATYADKNIFVDPLEKVAAVIASPSSNERKGSVGHCPAAGG